MPRGIIKRKNSFRVRLSEDVAEKLEQLANELGVPPATLLAVACGRYVAHESANMTAGQRAIASLTEDFKPVMREAIQEQRRLFPPKRRK